MTQYGFFFDQSRCTNCHACPVACKDWNVGDEIKSSYVKWLRMMQWEKGSWPEVEMHTLFATCYHCEKAPCAAACPNGALFKEGEFGAVLHDAERCTGCRRCWAACPYGAPQYEGDEAGLPMSKCTMCYDKLIQGELPVCVASCPQRALDFGPMEELVERYGDCRALEDMPAPAAGPSIVFKPRARKQQHVAYDPARAVEAMRRRGDTGLPDVFAEASDVTELFDGLVGYDKLVMKAPTAAENLARSKNEEG